MQLQVGKPVAGAEHYNGMVDCFRKIIAKEGSVRNTPLIPRETRLTSNAPR